MSHTHTAVVENRTSTPGNADRRARFVVPLLVAIGPAAIAGLRYVLPYNTTDNPEHMAAKVIAHQSRESLAIWLGFVAVFATVPAVVWVGRYALRYSRRLGTAAIAVLVPAFLALGLMMFSDLVMWTGADTGHSAADIGRMLDHMHPAATVGEIVFVIGHILGTVLLGIALWRAPIPRWIPLATIVCQPLHVFAGIVLANHAVDFGAWGLNAVAFAGLAVVVLRTEGART